MIITLSIIVFIIVFILLIQIYNLLQKIKILKGALEFFDVGEITLNVYKERSKLEAENKTLKTKNEELEKRVERLECYFKYLGSIKKKHLLLKQ